MKSVILNTAARVLLPLLLLLSLWVLYRGHNLPGGGFIGGLAAAAAYILYVLGPGLQAAKKALRVNPQTLMGVGLLVALISASISLLLGKTFMSGVWLPTLMGTVHLGTPFIFDIGVYLTVIGFTLQTTFSLTEAIE